MKSVFVRTRFQFMAGGRKVGMRTRADLAYEAAYLYALARLGAESDEYTHPEPAALNTAAELMGLTAEQIAPAIAYIMKRYAPSVSEAEDSAAYGALLDIAQKMQGRNE